MVPKMYNVMIDFMKGMVILWKSLIELIEAPLRTDHKEISARK